MCVNNIIWYRRIINLVPCKTIIVIAANRQWLWSRVWGEHFHRRSSLSLKVVTDMFSLPSEYAIHIVSPRHMPLGYWKPGSLPAPGYRIGLAVDNGHELLIILVMHIAVKTIMRKGSSERGWPLPHAPVLPLRTAKCLSNSKPLAARERVSVTRLDCPDRLPGHGPPGGVLWISQIPPGRPSGKAGRAAAQDRACVSQTVVSVTCDPVVG